MDKVQRTNKRVVSNGQKTAVGQETASSPKQTNFNIDRKPTGLRIRFWRNLQRSNLSPQRLQQEY